MSSLLTLPGLGKSSLELLEAVGFLDEESLAKAGLDELVKELERANSILKIVKRPPTRGAVEKWLNAARERVGHTETVESSPGQLVAVNYEGNPEVLTMVKKAPAALPVPAKILVENELAVGDIPPAVFLNRVVGDLDVRVSSESVDRPARPVGVTAVQLSEASPSRRDFDVSRIKSIADLEPAKPSVPATANAEEGDRVALIRAPRAETNKGRNPESRRYIRGVLHTHPLRMVLGAVFTLMLIVDLPLAIASAILLLMSDVKPEKFVWVQKWWLAFPLALPVIGFLYLIFGVNAGKCRICGQGQFFPKNCRKNAKAHHLPMIGYIIPTALHMLVFRWFRCTYCGTPVRLKE